MPWKKIILIDFLLIALLILATRFATFLHGLFFSRNCLVHINLYKWIHIQGKMRNEGI